MRSGWPLCWLIHPCALPLRCFGHCCLGLPEDGHASWLQQVTAAVVEQVVYGIVTVAA